MAETFVKVVHEFVNAIPGLKNPYGFAGYGLLVMVVAIVLIRLARLYVVMRLPERQRAAAFKREGERSRLALDLLAGVLVSGTILAVIWLVERRYPDLSKPLSSAAQYPLTIATSPDGADILIDDEPVGTSMRTVKIAEGKHAITVRKTGYKPKRDIVYVPQQDTVTLSMERE